MKVIQPLNTSFNFNTIATIGTFDGVHIGHQKILKQLTTTAREEGLKSVVLTFFPHPRMVLQDDANIKLINTIDERIKLMEAQNLDVLVIHPFTKAFSRMTAEEFVADILVDQLNIKKIIIGYDHHFGRNRSANIEELKQFGITSDFEVEEIPAQDINDVAVSSTKIRKALAAGDIGTANAYLGYHFSIHGEVVTGKGLGKKINFPTANINIEEDYKLIPDHGVYVVRSLMSDGLYYGMMNIGTNPTIQQSVDRTTIEVHFFDLNHDLYGNALTIEILQRVRDEQKFDSISELKHQIEKDKIKALSIIKHMSLE